VAQQKQDTIAADSKDPATGAKRKITP